MTTIQTGLANYLDAMYDEWKLNNVTFERKCQRNLEAIKGIDGQKKLPKIEEGEGWRSKTFIKLIKAKVFIAHSIIIDVYLQGGQVPFALNYSPFEEARIEERGEESNDENLQQMTDKIREQHSERRADKEYLKKILSLAYYGQAYSKYNIKDIVKSGYIPSIGQDNKGNPVEMPEFPEYVTSRKMVPGHEYRSVWVIISDPENDDLQKNRGVFEKELISPFELRQKKGGKFYIDAAIDEALTESVKGDTVKDQETLKPGMREVHYRKATIQSREFWGRVPRNLAQDFEKDMLGKNITTTFNPDVDDNLGDEVEVLAEMADETVIRYVRREIGDRRPYKKCLWEEALDENNGVSIADNMEDIQTSLNSMQRVFEDNKKLSGNVIIATKRRYLSPDYDGKVKPGMEIPLSDSCEDARQAFQSVVIPDVGESILSGIALNEKWGDVVSQVPTIAQGFSLAKHKPDTLGELQIQMENLGKYFGMVIRNIDEAFGEPEVNDLYDYNMRDQTYEGKKSDMKVTATGFTSFHNKIVVVQKLRELLSAALQDRSGLLLKEIKVRPHLEEIYKNVDVDVNKFLKSETEKNKDAQDAARLQAQAQEQVRREKAAELAAEEAGKEADFQRDMIQDQAKAATE